MPSPLSYVNVIVPLKLAWEPYYALNEDDSVQVGDRVTVAFAGRRYTGVVSAASVSLPPEVPSASVRAISGVRQELGRILPSEITFWRSIAQYYMCTVGEVYKAAYPSIKDEKPSNRRIRQAPPPQGSFSVSLDEISARVAEKLQEALSLRRPVLLSCSRSDDVIVDACLKAKGNVLIVVPEIKMCNALHDRMSGVFGDQLIVWGSDVTPSRRRAAVRSIRSQQEAYIVLGTRSSLFLPHHHLGLIVVMQEHDASHKQSFPAPRFGGRDAAVILGSQMGCPVVLESSVPSLDSLFNVLNGKYLHIHEGGMQDIPLQIIDTKAEMRKNGMDGDISRKLVHLCKGRKVAVFKPRRAVFPTLEELAPQIHSHLGTEVFITDDLVENPLPDGVEILAVFGVDAMLGRSDFRADERVLQYVRKAAVLCGGSLHTIVIQTHEAAHPVFGSISSFAIGPLLEERRTFNYPPFSRMIDIQIRDNDASRLSRMSDRLAHRISELGICSVTASSGLLRLCFERNALLSSRKATLLSVVENFEKEEKYVAHICFDVDPQ